MPSTLHPLTKSGIPEFTSKSGQSAYVPPTPTGPPTHVQNTTYKRCANRRLITNTPTNNHSSSPALSPGPRQGRETSTISRTSASHPLFVSSPGFFVQLPTRIDPTYTPPSHSPEELGNSRVLDCYNRHPGSNITACGILSSLSGLVGSERAFPYTLGAWGWGTGGPRSGVLS